MAVAGVVGPNTIAAAVQKGFVRPKGPNDFPAEVFDVASRECLSRLHPALADKIVALARAVPNPCAIYKVSAFRTFAEQHELYRKGRDLPGPKVSNADAGESYHNYGLAVDIYTRGVNPGDDNAGVMARGPIGRKLGLEWGGDWSGFKDFPHFQLPKGLSINECLALYRQGGIIAVGNEVTRRLGIRDPFPQGSEVEEWITPSL